MCEAIVRCMCDMCKVCAMCLLDVCVICARQLLTKNNCVQGEDIQGSIRVKMLRKCSHKWKIVSCIQYKKDFFGFILNKRQLQISWCLLYVG